jgi:calmodulin
MHIERREDEEAKQIFALFDKDDDGKIPLAEAGSLLRALNRAPSETELKALSTHFAQDHLTLEQLPTLLSLFPPLDSAQAQAELLAAFRVLDRESQGHIAAAELKRLLMSVGEKLSETEAEELIGMGEPDANGYISYEKFVTKLVNH